MNDKPDKFETVLKRPIDCTGELLEAFIKLVMQSEEVPINNLTRGVLQAEMLFFTVDKKKAIAGVSAIRFQNALYHQHLFEQAGVPEMYNPYSVESCWLSVKPEFRGQGVWKSNRKVRLSYLDNRPCHVIRRVENAYLDMSKSIYEKAGDDFYSKTSDDKLMLLVYNHDPVFDDTKRLRYV
jgi:GNAT superfamily N-acetyltransferase